MPKKFNGENTKASSAKERKATKAAQEKEQRDQEAEDALWKDDDKLIMKKNMRKEEKERKRLEEQQRKQEIKALAEQEESEQNAGSKLAAATKVTQFQLQQQRDRETAAASAPVPTHLDAPLVENTNRMEDVVSASGVDEAIRALCVDSTGPQDGGKPRMGRINMAAAFNAYVAQRLPIVKKDNPTLKLSQLMQRIRKEWQKSPDNPLNQMQS